MKQIMELIEKYIVKEVELEFQLALTESETISELNDRYIDFEKPNSSIEDYIQREINIRYNKRILEHIQNMKVN